MHPTLLKAFKKAKKHIETATNPSQKRQKQLKTKLEKLDKAQLIEYILAEDAKSSPPAKIADVVYAILSDPDCAWLTWDSLAAIITSSIPDSKTTATSLQWYPSHAKEGITIVPRKPTKEIIALLTSTLS